MKQEIESFIMDMGQKLIEIAKKLMIEAKNFDESLSALAIKPCKDEASVDYSIKSDKGKYRPTLCHQITIEAISRVREHGASRYGGTETWKRVEEQRYKDALYRHWLAYLENPDGVDAESGLPHLYHVACNVDFLLELQREKMENMKLHDDTQVPEYPNNSGCKFCEKFDFGSAKAEVDRHGASIVMAGGWGRFPIEQQFNFCPMCGKLLKPNRTEMSENGTTD